MIAVLTGDIINSQTQPSKKWLMLLSNYFNTFGNSPQTWEIYRGDEFQLKLNKAESALATAIHIKAVLKTLKAGDVRIGIGLGEEDYTATKVSHSSGSAYTHSGRIFEKTKSKKIRLLVKSKEPHFDSSINLMLKLALTFMDHWTQVSAQMLTYTLENPEQTQQEMARSLSVSQSTISQRLNRAHFPLIQELNAHFIEEVKKLKP